MFTGTSVRSGTARALTVRTGRATEIGAIAEHLQRRLPETDFERGLRQFGYLLARVAKRGVIVRRPSAIENLGSMDVLCTDKTGTLTEGEARVARACDASGAPSPAVLRDAFLNAVFQTGLGNPLDDAILAAARDAGRDAGAVKKLDEIPYDFVRKRLGVVIGVTAAYVLVTEFAKRVFYRFPTSGTPAPGSRARSRPA